MTLLRRNKRELTRLITQVTVIGNKVIIHQIRRQKLLGILSIVSKQSRQSLQVLTILTFSRANREWYLMTNMKLRRPRRRIYTRLDQMNITKRKCCSEASKNLNSKRLTIGEWSRKGIRTRIFSVSSSRTKWLTSPIRWKASLSNWNSNNKWSSRYNWMLRTPNRPLNLLPQLNCQITVDSWSIIL